MKQWERAVALAAAVSVLGGCGDLVRSSPAPAPIPGGTVGGVGVLPEPLSAQTPDPPSADRRGDSGRSDEQSTTSATSTRSAESGQPIGDPSAPVGERVRNNRILMIGDSILASTASRFGGVMCDALVPLGWAVEIDAEENRFIDFGTRVLDARLLPDDGVDWDAAVVMLGNNYRGEVEAFRAELVEMLDRLAPRPTVLFNVTEYRDLQAQVNLIMIDVAKDYPQVSLVDWNTLSSTELGVLSDDGLHLTPSGRTRLAAVVAFVLGPAPAGRTGACLSTQFTDDQPG